MARATSSLVLGLWATLLGAGVCSAQPATPKPGEPNPRFLELTNPKYYTVNSRLTVQAYQQKNPPKDQMPVIDQWQFQFAAIVFPMVKACASAFEDLQSPQNAKLTLDDRVMEQGPPQTIDQFPVGARYGLWNLNAGEGKMFTAREMGLTVSLPMVTHRTKYHDDAAAQVEWPAGPWPDEAASSFQPMSYVDHHPQFGPYDMESVKALIRDWTKGEDPKKLRPALLAKFLAGQVASHVRVSGKQFMAGPTGMLEGILLRGAPVTAKEGQGTPFELVCLLTAVYREAGLPARMVIGVKAGRSRKDLEFLDGKKGRDELHAWVEWCLYDETDKTVTWIPVDIIEIRASSSRRRGEFWNEPMRYFGTHDKLDDVVPLSFHFFPPTTVRSYGGSQTPAFWGWFVGPVSPGRAEQSLLFQVTSTPARAGQDRDGQRQR
ncbi:MAG: transglutaminase domain-containing protein [Phycisphaerales bacterium]|nr:transglutaminase domain-containing protein [Phycisphaerales bacterium]